MKPVEEAGYKIRVEKDVYVTMRDGVRLAVDIYRPDAPGKFPALVALSPYGKDMQTCPIPFPQPNPERDHAHKTALWDGCIEAGPTELIVSRGYVHVIGDLRGTGKSEGEYNGMLYFTTQEGLDGYDVVEWIAEQPWCDGNVGGIGMSNIGMQQVRIALHKPPHYKSIAPFFFHPDVPPTNGIQPSYMFWLYPGHDTNSGFSPRNVGSALQKMLPQEKLDRLVENALKNNPALMYDPRCYKVLMNPHKNPIMFDQLVSSNNPGYFPKPPMPPYHEIDIPCFMGAYGMFAGFDLYNLVKGPKKLMCWSPEEYEPRPWQTGIDQVLRWHDHWLKGIDTGIMDEPSIKLFVTGDNQWRWENEWPLARTQWNEYYLRSWERLSPEPEVPNEFPDCYLQEPVFVSSRRGSLEYLTAPLGEDTEVTGQPVVYLYAAIDQDDTYWRVQIFDVDEQGNETAWPNSLSETWLKASYKGLDESKSKPHEPIHSGVPEPVVPGEIYEYAFLLTEMSNTFRKGHRIKLKISSMLTTVDPDSHTGTYVLSICKPTLHKIYRDDVHRSRVLLPVIPKS